MLKIKDMNLNNVIRQGDSQPREYQLDTGNLDLNLTNKSATIRLMTADFQGIGYETTATVSSENKISFSIDDVIPARQYRLEVTVDDYVFPSRATDGQFSIDPSSHGQEVNIIQVIGKDEIVREVKEQIEPFLGEIEQAEREREETHEKVKDLPEAFQNVIDETTGKDVISAPEIIAARKGKASLGEKIDEVDKQLAQKIGGGVKGSLSDFDEDTLNFIHDGTGGPIEIGSRPEDYSVGPKQTTFIKVSSNLLNVNDRENGYRTNLSDGSLESHLQFAVSDFIPIKPNEKYTIYGAERYSLYDSSKTHIISKMWNYPTDIRTETTTENTRFIRVSFRQDVYNAVYNEIRLNEGGELLPYEPVYKPTFDKDKVDIELDAIELQIEDYSVDPKHTTFIKTSSNMLNVNEREDGYRTNLTNGTLESHNQFSVSGFIPVKKGVQYTMYGVERYSLYDDNKNHISSEMWSLPTNIKTITTTADTRFIRVSFRQQMFNPVSISNEVRLNEGRELLPHEDYGNYLDNDITIDGNSIIGSSSSGKAGGINLESGVYTSPLLEGGTPATSAEVIELFDTLVDGEYVTKKIWGQDDFGNDLVSYKASKPNMVTPTGLEPIRFGFSSGTHGNEQNTAVGLFHFLKDLIENKNENFTFMKIQSLVELHWFPQVNPSGWDLFTYHTGNDVDIHRNFTSEWYDFEHPNKGSGPASEPETQAVEAWLSESELDYYFDIHTTVAIDDSWMAVADIDSDEGKKLIEDYYKTRSFLSNWWGEREDIDFPKNTVMGHVRDYNPTGKQYAHAWNAEGANSLLLELADRYSPDVLSRGPVTNTFSAETIGNLFLQVLKRNGVF